MVSNQPTLRENPRLYLHNRANRLNRLCELKAPPIILRGEVALVLQALAEVVKQEEPNVKLTVEFEALRAKLTYPEDKEATGAHSQ
jgi:hypothetical protein